MPDHEHLDPRLDNAFAAFTRDLAHAPSPGAAAAISTARRHRRTRVGGVTLAALLVVGGGLTLPGLVGAGDGVASDGGAAPLDAAALETATRGWLSGWEAWERYSPKGGGSFSVPACLSSRDATALTTPQLSWGLSRFVGSELAMATATFDTYPDAEAARAAQSGASAACGGATTTVVDGVEVWHYAEAPTPGGTSVTDVWTARIGAERLTLEVAGRAGVAPASAADRMAEAVVAGLRSGETQESFEGDPRVGDPSSRPALPSVDDGDLTRALDGWRAATRRPATGVPDVPCLLAQVDDGSVSGVRSGTPGGVSWMIGGFEDATTGPANVRRMLDELASCTDPRMSVTTVADGVTLVSYDSGGAEGHGALWLLAVGDRAMVAAVGGASDPMPAGVADDVAAVMDDWLRLPWR